MENTFVWKIGVNMVENRKTKLAQKGKGFIGEFKTFVSKGNVMDLSVGIIIGSAFTAVVTALTSNVLMPIIGVALGGVDFSKLAITFGSASIGYGSFIQSVLNFFLIALTVFFLVKGINIITRKKEEKKEPSKPSDEILILTEIRDLLKMQQEK